MSPMGKQHQPAYDTWADYYDVTDADRTPYIEFYKSVATPRMSSLLELGCGTGTIAGALKNGSPGLQRTGRTGVVGLDESSRMLRIARRNHPDACWVRGDLCALPFSRSFDLVICCFNTLQHLLTLHHLERALAQVRAVVSSSGVFAFDVYQPNEAYLRIPQSNRL